MRLQFHWFKTLSAAALVAFSTVFAVSALQMGVYSDFGPGAGLFPLSLSLILAVLTLLWLLKPLVDSEIPERLSRDGVLRVVTVIGSVLGSILLMPYLGFTLTSSLAIFVIMMVTGNHRAFTALGLAIGSSIGFQMLFQRGLNLALPVSQLPVLSSLGL